MDLKHQWRGDFCEVCNQFRVTDRQDCNYNEEAICSGIPAKKDERPAKCKHGTPKWISGGCFDCDIERRLLEKWILSE